MKPEIREVMSEEIDVPLADFKPDESDDFGITFRLLLGAAELNGSEVFEVLVCTPAWLARICAQGVSIWGTHTLIVPEYDFNSILRELETQFGKCVGETWGEVATKASRFGAWEFEDYSASR